MADKGCEYSWTTGAGRNMRTHYCHKKRQPGNAWCPHHILLSSELEAENARKMERARNGKEKKALARKYLETSPLRADNPQYSARYE